MTATDPQHRATAGAARWLPLLLAVVYFAIMMPFGAQLILHYPDERHYAYGGARMVDTGNWLIPETPQGEIRLKKPILPYWFSAAGFEVLGISVAGFRLFWVIGAGVVLLLTYGLARALGAGPRTALLAELFLAANPIFLRETVASIPDMPLTLFMTLSALGFVRLMNASGPPPAWAGWAAWIGIALAVLSKGLLPAAFACFVIAFNAAFDRGRLTAVLAPAPLAVALALVLAWYLSAGLSHPQAFMDQFFGDQVAGKITRSLLAPLLAFPGYLLAGIASFLAWPLILVLGFARRLRPPAFGTWPAPVAMLALWCVVVMAIFAVGGFVAARYLLPILPVAAAFLAMAFAAVDGEDLAILSGLSRRLLIPATIVNLLLAVLAAAIVAQLVSVGAGILALLAAAAITLAIHAASRRRPRLAPHLLAATPLLTVAILYLPFAALVLPDIGAPLAARLAATGASPANTVFIGGVHEASATRLHAGRSDPFREVRTLADIGDACVVLTTIPAIAGRLRLQGYRVETVTGGWRAVEPRSFAEALLAWRLAAARADNAARAFFAICPNGLGATAATGVSAPPRAG